MMKITAKQRGKMEKTKNAFIKTMCSQVEQMFKGFLGDLEAEEEENDGDSGSEIEEDIKNGDDEQKSGNELRESIEDVEKTANVEEKIEVKVDNLKAVTETQDNLPSPEDTSSTASPEEATIEKPPVIKVSCNTENTLNSRCTRRHSEDSGKINRFKTIRVNSQTIWCPIGGCNRSFPRRNDFINHYDSEHYKVNFTCMNCNITNWSGSRVFMHEYINHQEGLFQCARDDCSFFGPYRCIVMRHFDSEHVSGSAVQQGVKRNSHGQPIPSGPSLSTMSSPSAYYQQQQSHSGYVYDPNRMSFVFTGSPYGPAFSAAQSNSFQG